MSDAQSGLSDSVRTAVRKGAALLDEKEPGWRDRIVPAELTMSDCAKCVIGQVLGIQEGTHDVERYYATLAEWLGLDDDGAAIGTHEDLGFYTATGNWGTLRDAWIGYIKGEWS